MHANSTNSYEFLFVDICSIGIKKLDSHCFMLPIKGVSLGISSTFWFIMGLTRWFTEVWARRFSKKKSEKSRYKASEIAAILPAHNEELAIRTCISALKLSLTPSQIHVVSDGSTDNTFREAKKEKVHVSQTPGLGKAKAIIYAINRYRLYSRYKFIFIVDSDTRIDRHFIKRALPMFNDPEVGVAYGTAKITWPNHIIPQRKFYYVAYRERLNRMLQYFFAYGQTWKYTNMTYVIPGFCTLWRTHILKKVNIDTPGLLIEDFNTAFQVHRNHICKIAYNPNCIGWDQHPETLSDYWKQVRRWNIGFFQTVRIHGVWPSWYWLALGVFSAEVFLNSFFMLCLPLFLPFLVIDAFHITHPLALSYAALYRQFGLFQHVRLIDVFVALFVIDYGMTVVIGLSHKKPQFILYGLFFFIMHYVTSLILFSALIPGFFSKSIGRWTSPKRSLEQMSVKV